MELSNIWGQGQLFAFSGLDGDCGYRDCLVGYLCGDKVGIKFKLPLECELFLSAVKFKKLDFFAVTSDLILASADGERICFAMLDQYTVVGEATKKCKIALFEDNKNEYETCLFEDDNRFSFAIGKSLEDVTTRAENGMKCDLNSLIASRLSFYKKFTPNKLHEKLYYKCLSVMKTQIYTPEGKMTHYWSTPDRYPHRSMWLWDSVYHAIGFMHIDVKLAQELILSIFAYQTEDGFIPHFSNTDGCSQISQPPVIAYGAMKVFEKSKDIDFLRYVFERNDRFLSWCDFNRRKTDKALYTWLTEPDLNCRCGESGMDNSTRFDNENELYAVDFTAFMANEARWMAKIAKILGIEDKEKYYVNKFNLIKKTINEYLWDDEAGFYFDKEVVSGKMSDVSSIASFLPLFAGLCDKYHAQRLLKMFYAEYNTAVPIPTISRLSKYYGDDMWRGPVWINFNYLIAEGFEEYGYTGLADTIRKKTVSLVEKWYLLTGCTFEFYDSEDKTPPYLLNRKGKAVQPYNPSVRYQSIHDYGWTTTLVFDLLNQ